MPVDFAGPALRCAACGYDLRGLARDGCCPECNRLIRKSSVQGTSRFVTKPESPVDAGPDVTCVRCGAALGGCSSHADCPACGGPVWLSLDGDWLCVRDPDWLRPVRRAPALWMWAVIIDLVLIVTGTAVPWIWPFAFTGRAAALMPFFIIRAVVRTGLVLLSILFAWSAAYLLSAPNPATVRSESWWTLRHWIRALLWLDVATRIPRWCLNWLGPETLSSLMPTAVVFSACVEVALTLVLIAYVRSLCRRLPDENLVRSFKTIFWVYCVLGAAELVWKIVAAILGDDPGPVVGRGWGWAMLYFAPAVVSLVFGISYCIRMIMVLPRFRRHLLEIATPGL